MRMKIFLFVLLTLFLFNKTNAIIKIDEKIPPVALNEQTQLTVLNSRFGSRFSLTLAFRDYGVHTGSLGYDQDEQSELLISVSLDEGNYCFRTCALPAGMKYLKNQNVRVGMTSINLSGETDHGIKVNASIVSPFTSSNDLKDTANIKVQIAPAFYIISELVAPKGKTISGLFKTGLRKNLIHNDGSSLGAKFWVYNSVQNEIFFRDNSSIDDRLSLAVISKMHHHFSFAGFNGLQTTFTASSGKTVNDTLIYAACYKGKVLQDNKYNTPLRFYYTQYFNNLNQVINYARTNAKENLKLSEKFENIITRSNISNEERWIIPITFRSDVANTFFLLDNNNHARFYVAEGRFRHLSTTDVAHETELMAIFAPWRLKIQLEIWMDYLARKEIDRGIGLYGKHHKEGMSASEYGPFIEHDVGDMPFVSISSDYIFGPHMAAEENCNYALLLYWYWKISGDDAYVKSQLGMLDVILYSLMNRDTDGNGIVDKGMGWSTFDNADVLKQSPENVFLGVKQMMAYLVSADMFEILAIKASESTEIKDIKDAQDGKDIGYENGILDNDKLRIKQAEKYRTEAKKIVATLKAAQAKYGYIPASLDESYNGWGQYSTVISDGLFLPGLSGFSSPIIDEILPDLKQTFEKAYQLCKTDRGIKHLSSEEGIWFSKNMVVDVVASYWFNISTLNSALYAYKWNLNNYYAYNDGINSDAKTSWIGFWYPRGIASLGYILRDSKFTAPQRELFLKDLK